MMIDTHRHLGGSVPVSFLYEAMECGACDRVPYSELRNKLVYQSEEPRNFNHFLSKFRFLDTISWTQDLIDIKLKLVCESINNDDCDAAFIDFSVSKYRHIGWSLKESISFILDRFSEYSTKFILPILSIKYESPFEIQKKISKISEDSISDKLCGIDFVGDEMKFDFKNQKYICDMWRGKLIRLHVGESRPQENIRKTLENIGVTNIAHGIKIADKDLVKMSIDNDVTYDVAPTSNYITGVVETGSLHPSISMCRSGLSITVGSDDPVVLDTDLRSEYELLRSQGMSEVELDKIQQNSTDMFHKWKKYSIRNISLSCQ
jgi:adenosine deaminase